MILCTVECTNDGAQTVRLSLFRNDVDMSAENGLYATTVEAAGIKTFNAHFYDPMPGDGMVSYSVRGSATGVPTTTAGNRRVTVTTE